MPQNSLDKSTIRADKLLSSLGIASRRGIEIFLKSNSVTANNIRITEHGQRIPIRSIIKINGRELSKPKRVYFLLNKPRGIVSTASDEFGRKNVVNLVKTSERIFPVGRLDRNTHGLLILTNDGELTNMLIHPRYHVPKTYTLKIKSPVNTTQIENFEKGVELEDGTTNPCKVKVIQRRKDATILEVILYEGKKRQIRRMCEALKLPLADLERIRFGNLTLDGIKEGEYRTITGVEIEKLKKLCTS